MPGVIYTSSFAAAYRGQINFDADLFKVLLVTDAYIPNKDTHTKRSDITNEVSGVGYTPGGMSVVMDVAIDNENNWVDMLLGPAEWLNSTITARGAVYFKDRGGAASADEIIAYIDFEIDIISINGAFTLAPSTLRIENPDPV